MMIRGKKIGTLSTEMAPAEIKMVKFGPKKHITVHRAHIQAKFKSVSAVFGWETEDDIALSNEIKVSFAYQALISQHRTNIVVYTFSANNCWYWLKFSLIRMNVSSKLYMNKV